MTDTHTYTGDEPMRLNKWMAQLGLCSRREAETLIMSGSVKVDGEPVSEPGHKISPGQILSLAGKAAKALDDQLTVVIHKPVGFVSAQPEPEQTPAIRLATRENLIGSAPKLPGRSTNFAPLGRLDMDSRGLLLLSEDGVLAKAIIGPSSELEKEYIVTVKGQVTPQALAQLRHGLSLDGRRLKAADVEQMSPGRLRFVLREGRNRQIRRMCELVGLLVVDLLRIRIGSLKLGDLPEGKWRALSSQERQDLIENAPVISASPPTESGGKPARKTVKKPTDPTKFGRSKRRKSNPKPISKYKPQDGPGNEKSERPKSPRKSGDGRPGRSGKPGGRPPSRSKRPGRD
ncbi:pseudouridine synthase [Henriciella litoralis]|uniref:pseudouridine synthase n=1 Tax=Henriciella litoralis TaxID=568102 RepID=UPI0009FD65E2|nr:pseudouridine synthase [Henriciella litoralis]